MVAKKRWHVKGMLVAKSPLDLLFSVYPHLFMQISKMSSALLPESMVKNLEDSEQR